MYDAAKVTSLAAKPSERNLLVCFSHLRWDFVFQRPHHLMTRAARDRDVIYFEEPEFCGSGPAELRRRRHESGVEIVTPVLPEGRAAEDTAHILRNLLETLLLPAAGSTLTFWYYTPMAMEFSHHIPPDLCVYDCMDELSMFRNPPAGLVANEDALFGRADIVFTGGMSLYAAKRKRHPNVHAFPSSVDAAHFAVAREQACVEPADQAGIPGPRVGFFGVIDERMDLDLVAALARLRPDVQFVMIGPVVKIDPNALPQAANLHWLGGKRYDDLPRYLARWDAGFMPFAINDATRFISPTKTPEFLAAGRPVVSTPVTDVVDPYGEQGLVEIAATPEAFVQALDRVLERPLAPWLSVVDRKLSRMSWDRTWARMRQRLDTALAHPREDVAALSA